MHRCLFFRLAPGKFCKAGSCIYQVGSSLQIALVVRDHPGNVRYGARNVRNDALHAVQVLSCRRRKRLNVLHRLRKGLQRRQKLRKNYDQDSDGYDRHHQQDIDKELLNTNRDQRFSTSFLYL